MGSAKSTIPYETSLTSFLRLRHVLRRLSRILFHRLDLGRKSQRHGSNRNDPKRRHVPLHAFPLRAVYQAMGPETPSCSVLWNRPYMSQFPPIVLQHSSLASNRHAGSDGSFWMRPHLQPHHALSWRMVHYHESSCSVRSCFILQKHRRLCLPVPLPSLA